jgi:hypothetical protein
MERGCVKDQPQQVKDSESLEDSKALRLVEDDTAALRHFSSTLSGKSDSKALEIKCGDGAQHAGRGAKSVRENCPSCQGKLPLFLLIVLSTPEPW